MNSFVVVNRSTLLTRWIATAALRDGIAAELLALNPVDLFVDDSSIDATAAVECDGAAHDSRYSTDITKTTTTTIKITLNLYKIISLHLFS